METCKKVSMASAGSWIVQDVKWHGRIPDRSADSLGPWVESGRFHDFRHLLFPLDGHDVKSPHPFDSLELLNLLNADLHSFLGRSILGNPGQTFDDLVGNIHSGNPGLHDHFAIPTDFMGLTRQDGHLAVQPPIHHFIHPFLELGHVVYALSLDELGSCRDLLRQSKDPDLEGSAKGSRRPR